MVLYWLMYLTVLVVAAVLAILYPDYTPALLLAGVLSYPVVAWAELMLHRIFLSVRQVGHAPVDSNLEENTWTASHDLEIQALPETRKEISFLVRLQISNKSFFPIWHLRERYRITNRMTGQSQDLNRDSELEPYDQKRRTLKLFPEHYGLYVLEEGKLQLSDMFGLIRLKKRLPAWDLVLCTPLSGEEEGEESFLPEQVASSITEQSQEPSVSARQGEEEPELREIREFQPGDRQNRIHQRLSAKLEKPMVRVLETEDLPGLLLVPLLHPNAFEENDRCLELLAALIRQCIRERIRAEAWLPDGQLAAAGSEEELEALFYQLLSTPLFVQSHEESFATTGGTQLIQQAGGNPLGLLVGKKTEHQEKQVWEAEEEAGHLEERLPAGYQTIAWIDGNGIRYQTRGGRRY